MVCVYYNTKYIGIVSHWDLDGIVAASLLVYGSEEHSITWDLRLSTPSRLLKSIEEVAVQGGALAVADLNPNPQAEPLSLRKLLAKPEKTYWFDHHEWPRKILEDLSTMKRLHLIIDPEATSSELVARHLENECGLKLLEPHREILEVAVADDKNKGSPELFEEVYKWRIILRSIDWPTKYRIAELFANGELWSEWLEEIYSKSRAKYEKELSLSIEKTRLYTPDCGLKIAVVKASEQLNPSDVYNRLKEKIEADIYVISYGKGVSLRSEEIDVRRIAQKLGGGGHPKASGARLKNTKTLEEIAKIIASIACKQLKAYSP